MKTELTQQFASELNKLKDFSRFLKEFAFIKKIVADCGRPFIVGG